MKNLKKYSFTIIELILAIVIIGIVVVTIPMLLSTSSKFYDNAIKEQSFFNAYSLMTLITNEYWDENNTKDENYYKVLTSDNGDSELKCSRKGVLELNNSSGADCATDDNKTSSISIDENEDENNVSTFDDIDDFNSYSTLVEDINFSVKVWYLDDSTDYSKKNIFFNVKSKKDDSNIKMIEINVTNTQNNELISVLKYFSSNIGMVKIESRSE